MASNQQLAAQTLDSLDKLQVLKIARTEASHALEVAEDWDTVLELQSVIRAVDTIQTILENIADGTGTDTKPDS